MRRATPLLLLFGTLVAFAGDARAQRLGGGESTDISLWRVFAALTLCLVLAVAAALALRYRMTGRFELPWHLAAPLPRRLVLLERLRVTPQAEICLVALDGQEWLLTLNQSTMQLQPCSSTPPTTSGDSA